MCVELTVLRGQVVCLFWKWAAGAYCQMESEGISRMQKKCEHSTNLQLMYTVG